MENCLLFLSSFSDDKFSVIQTTSLGKAVPLKNMQGNILALTYYTYYTDLQSGKFIRNN